MEKIITPENIAEILASDVPVLIDFWAPWCGPCRVLSPTVDEIAAEFEGRVVVAKCNVDDCESISNEYGIRNVPTLMFFKNGEMVDRTAGLVTKNEIVNKLNNIL